MKHYEMDIQGRELCERHGKLRCDECAYIAELEDRIDHMKDVGATNIEYMRELEWRKERYEKALEFYSDENNYDDIEYEDFNSNGELIPLSKEGLIDRDNGERAREALKEDE